MRPPYVRLGQDPAGGILLVFPGKFSVLFDVDLTWVVRTETHHNTL